MSRKQALTAKETVAIEGPTSRQSGRDAFVQRVAQLPVADQVEAIRPQRPLVRPATNDVVQRDADCRFLSRTGDRVDIPRRLSAIESRAERVERRARAEAGVLLEQSGLWYRQLLAIEEGAAGIRESIDGIREAIEDGLSEDGCEALGGPLGRLESALDEWGGVDIEGSKPADMWVHVLNRLNIMYIVRRWLTCRSGLAPR